MTVTTIPLLDGSGAAIDVVVVADGTGNIAFGKVLFKTDGATPVNPATSEKQDAAIAAITAAAVAMGSVGGFPSARWQSGPVTVSATDQALKAAGAAGIKTVADWGVLVCDATWTANTVQVRDGTTVLFALPLPAGAGFYPLPAGITLVGSAATALNIKATGAVTGTCTANIGGHSGAY